MQTPTQTSTTQTSTRLYPLLYFERVPAWYYLRSPPPLPLGNIRNTAQPHHRMDYQPKTVTYKFSTFHCICFLCCLEVSQCNCPGCVPKDDGMTSMGTVVCHSTTPSQDELSTINSHLQAQFIPLYLLLMLPRGELQCSCSVWVAFRRAAWLTSVGARICVNYQSTQQAALARSSLSHKLIPVKSSRS